MILDTQFQEKVIGPNYTIRDGKTATIQHRKGDPLAGAGNSYLTVVDTTLGDR